VGCCVVCPVDQAAAVTRVMIVVKTDVYLDLYPGVQCGVSEHRSTGGDRMVFPSDPMPVAFRESCSVMS